MEARIVNEILKKNEQLLKRHLVLSKTVLDKLHEKGLVADIIRRKILMYPAHKQVPLLIQSLENRGLPSLRKFLEVLKETGHSYLVENVLDTEAIPVTDFRPSTQPGKGGHDSPTAYRPTHTVHASHRGPANVASLNSLLRMRHDQQTVPRGSFVPRTLLTDPVMLGNHDGSSAGMGSGGYNGAAAAYRAPPMPAPYAARREDVPATLYCLGQVFTNQQKENEQAMVVLRQEEMAIKQLMEQNARDQQKIRRKQYTMSDLSKKLADLNARANDFYEPVPHPSMGRYRLAQLNQIPWSVDR